MSMTRIKGALRFAQAIWWIAITLTENVKERARRLHLVSDFMAWKLSPGFILATELHEPDALVSVGVRHDDYAALISVIRREPLDFEPAKLLKRENMDPAKVAVWRGNPKLRIDRCGMRFTDEASRDRHFRECHRAWQGTSARKAAPAFHDS
jgi:hypothetical protein